MAYIHPGTRSLVPTPSPLHDTRKRPKISHMRLMNSGCEIPLPSIFQRIVRLALYFYPTVVFQMLFIGGVHRSGTWLLQGPTITPLVVMAWTPGRLQLPMTRHRPPVVRTISFPGRNIERGFLITLEQALQLINKIYRQVRVIILDFM